MEIFIKENTWIPRGIMDLGWGNGYVLIPEGHPLHGKYYDEIDVQVNCGLTFSELIDARRSEFFGLHKESIGKWCVGFDTAHCDDTLEKWPKERVLAETERLRDQLMAF